jgi:hypothetical protein
MVALIRVEEAALGVEKVAHYVSGPLRGWGTYVMSKGKSLDFLTAIAFQPRLSLHLEYALEP